MKRTVFTLWMAALALSAASQNISINKARFHKGDNIEWAKPEASDADWDEMSITKRWDDQGYSFNNAYVWYRIHLTIPSSLLDGADQQKTVVFDLPKADDADEAYLNGRLIGKTGSMPSDEGGFKTSWNSVRSYAVDVKEGGIRWDQENVIAIRVYNGGEPGGLFERPLVVRVPNITDGLHMTFHEATAGKETCTLELDNEYTANQVGKLTFSILDRETGEVRNTLSRKLTVRKGKPVRVSLPYDKTCRNVAQARFVDAKSGKYAEQKHELKFLLTPPAPATPRFNTPAIFGVRPESPVIFRFGISGEKPIKVTANELPKGLKLTEDGVLSGSIKKQGEIHFTVTAENAKGKAQQDFTLRVGWTIALTPPMGWNSWNCWALSVSQEKVMSSAQALIDKGLADYGYCYMNIDDGWEAPERNADGTIAVNEKFPSMKALGDWLHERGLKFGIYSSPGDRTCGGFLGSIDHEQQDAESYNSWGVDYLKYDWCGYGRAHEKERDTRSVASFVRPYLLMQKHLRNQPRDIFYSLCQYGMAKVWEWGPFVDANSWRTTGDITDTWGSLYDIGFHRQAGLSPYAAPGHWNDPDMLVVGKVGWSSNLRDSRLTPDEQYTHITLWTLLAANMLIGCDIAQMDEFTLNLLCNNEVNAINQDILGQQADRAVKDGDIQIWTRPLADGSHAIGIFNVGEDDLRVDFSKYMQQLGIQNLQAVRDLWRQRDLDTTRLQWFIPSHGCEYIKVSWK